MSALEITLLGCGSSGGVPRADGEWGACDPGEPKNLRSRCSLLVRRPGQGAEASTTLIVDTSPDLRLQTAHAGAKRLDAILLTHDHADQVHGIDDVRAFYIRQRAKIGCWMDAATEASMIRRFGYIYEGEGGYPAVGGLCSWVARCPGTGIRPASSGWIAPAVERYSRQSTFESGTPRR